MGVIVQEKLIQKGKLSIEMSQISGGNFDAKSSEFRTE